MSAKKQKLDNSDIITSTELVTDLITLEDEAHLKWKLYGFKGLFKSSPSNIRVNSSKFVMNDNRNVDCQICIFPKGAEVGTGHKNYMAFKLSVDAHPFEVVSSDLSVHMSVFVGIDDDEENTHRIWEKEFSIGKEAYEKMMREELYLKAAKDHCVDDLTLECTVRGKFTVTASSIRYKSKTDKSGCPAQVTLNKVMVEPTMPPLYEKLLNDVSFSDVNIHVDGKVIKAHKNILAVCSPVFSAMFQNEWKEKQDSSLTITDSSYDVIQSMLHYMYTGTIPNTNIVDRLFVAAHKYDIKDLRKFCELKLEKNIHYNTAWGLLILADKYGVKPLKVKVMNFIASNKKTMLMQPHYKDVLTNYPTLIAEFFAHEI